MNSSYQDTIRAVLSSTGHAGQYKPHQIEAFMRLAHSTLDGLSIAAFRCEVEIARVCIDNSSPIEAEGLAASFGLSEKKAS